MWQALCWPIPLFSSIICLFACLFLIIWETYSPEHYPAVCLAYMSRSWNGEIALSVICSVPLTLHGAESDHSLYLIFITSHGSMVHISEEKEQPKALLLMLGILQWEDSVSVTHSSHPCTLDLLQNWLFGFVPLYCIAKPALRNAVMSWSTTSGVLPSNNLCRESELPGFVKAFPWMLRLLCFRPGRCESSYLLSSSSECYHLASYPVYFSSVAVILAIKCGKEIHQFIQLDTHITIYPAVCSLLLVYPSTHPFI